MALLDVEHDGGDFALRSVTERNGFLDELSVDPVQLLATIRLARLAKLQEAEDQRTLRKFSADGLRSVEDIRTLAMLGRHQPDGLTNVELLEELGGSKGAMSIRLDRLVKQGIVVQTRSGLDARLKLNGLTEQGVEVAERSVTALLENRVRMFNGLSHDQVAQLGSMVGNIIQLLNPND